ncbi:MAG: ABC transporter permease [Acidimicrobiales bacterium]
MTLSFDAVWQLMVRVYLVTIRIPAAIVPTLIFPLFFLITFTGVYVSLTRLPGFPTDNIYDWFVPFMILQGAAFAGIGAGFSLGRDIETGFMDRILLTPQPRITLMVGPIAAYVLRSLFTAMIVLTVGVLLGSALPNLGGFILLGIAVVGISIVASCWSMGLMYRAKDLSVAPLFQLVIFIVMFVSNAQVPVDVSTGWLQVAARVNPLTNVLRMARQGHLEDSVVWANTWPGLLALALGIVIVGAWAYRGLLRYTP